MKTEKYYNFVTHTRVMMATNDKDLRFNQQSVINIDDVVSADAKGVPRIEGVTCFSAKNGNVYLSERPLNAREEEKGTNIPRTHKEELDFMKHLASKFAEFEDLRTKKIFFLVCNKYSTFCHEENKILILGYYDHQGQFLFACQDENLMTNFPEYINTFGNARDIFLREGCVIYPDLKNGQPVTLVSTASSYHFITEELSRAKKEIKTPLSNKEPRLITDTQAFIWIYSKNQELGERIISNISNEHKRNELNRVKESFLYFNNYLGDEKVVGLSAPYKMFMCCRDPEDKHGEVVTKSWKLVFGNIRKEIKEKGFTTDLFMNLTRSTLFITIARMCVKFNKDKHALMYYDENSGDYFEI